MKGGREEGRKGGRKGGGVYLSVRAHIYHSGVWIMNDNETV